MQKYLQDRLSHSWCVDKYRSSCDAAGVQYASFPFDKYKRREDTIEMMKWEAAWSMSIAILQSISSIIKGSNAAHT